MAIPLSSSTCSPRTAWLGAPAETVSIASCRNDDHWSLDEQLAGRQAPTHLGTILHALGVGYRRVVARDNTVRLVPRWVQLRGPRSYAGVRVEVREMLDGRLVVVHDGRLLATRRHRATASCSSRGARPVRNASRARLRPPPSPAASHQRQNSRGPPRLACASMGHRQEPLTSAGRASRARSAAPITSLQKDWSLLVSSERGSPSRPRGRSSRGPCMPLNRFSCRSRFYARATASSFNAVRITPLGCASSSRIEK
jgi:hypothetical protein